MEVHETFAADVPAVEMRGITKIYPNGIAASRGVDFSVSQGEIHALMGENGAGKSTLMKMLFGLEQPTEGEILIHGQSAHLNSPTAAIAQGIGMVHQHFMLVPSLTVAENMVLGMAPRRGLFLDTRKARTVTTEAAEKFNLRVDPDARVADIPVGMKQKVEILKALVRGAKILILDEPTAVLTSQETQELFRELVHLKSQGYTIIFISHKLQEIMEITDRITILRRGRSMGVLRTRDTTREEISRRMVGRDVALNVEKPPLHSGAPVLQVRSLDFTNSWGKKMLDQISFTVRSGEIMGVAGVEGNGQKELMDVLFGLQVPDDGAAAVQGNPILGRTQRQIRAQGVCLIPEDRMLYGIAKSASVEENLMAECCSGKPFNRGPLFRMQALDRMADQLIRDYAILCKSRQQEVSMLSGGNIQKVVVAREFSGSPLLILADQPTRGIDVGATAFIRRKLVELARAGAAVLLVSADLSEVIELSDRLMIMHNGRISAFFDDTRSLTDEVMGRYMLGLDTQTPEEIGRACNE